MRILGFDVVYLRDARDEQLITITESEERTLLTKDAKLLRENKVNGYLVRSISWEDQLREVIAEFDLRDHIDAFSRCLECNVELTAIEKEMVKDVIPEKVYEFQEEFYICPNCRRIYWTGTHVERMRKKLAKILEG